MRGGGSGNQTILRLRIRCLGSCGSYATEAQRRGACAHNVSRQGLHRVARIVQGCANPSWIYERIALRHREACEDLSEVAALADVDANVLVNLAVFRIINGQTAEALTAAERAVELEPESLQARLVAADAAGAAGDWERSRQAAQEALQRSARGNDRERASAAVAEALRRLRRLDEAQALKRAWRRLPTRTSFSVGWRWCVSTAAIRRRRSSLAVEPWS